ncbi:MAG: CARDB domain-containing protein [Candidatus Methanofastidiosia archaeon]
MKKTITLLVCVVVFFNCMPFVVSANGPDLKVSFLNTIGDLNTNTTTVSATIKNVGNASTITASSPTGLFDIELNVTSPGVGAGPLKASAIRRRGPLVAGGQVTVSAVFQGTNWKNAHAIADVNKEIPETDEQNNSKGTCNWAYIIDFHDLFETPLYVGNITYDPADVELVIDYVSPGMSVTLDQSMVHLEVGDVTVVTMTVLFEPGFTEGQVVILGVYSDGYTVSPATIDFVDTNP